MMMRWTVEERAAASEQQQDALRARSRRRRQRRQPIRHTPPPDNDAPLAKKITEYILDNQDDAAQEERWRTTMKRETMKRFREQRDEQREHVQKVETCFREQREHVQKVEMEMQALQLRMDRLIELVTPQNE